MFIKEANAFASEIWKHETSNWQPLARQLLESKTQNTWLFLKMWSGNEFPLNYCSCYEPICFPEPLLSHVSLVIEPPSNVGIWGYNRGTPLLFLDSGLEALKAVTLRQAAGGTDQTPHSAQAMMNMSLLKRTENGNLGSQTILVLSL